MQTLDPELDAMNYVYVILAAAAMLVAGPTWATPDYGNGQPSASRAVDEKAVRFDRLTGYSGAQTAIANRIATKFAAAGFGPVQQIAAVSVAIHESTLNPEAVNRGCNCYGLFQMNRSGGLGKGHAVSDLTNADYNIRLIIKEAKRFPRFGSANSLDSAVDAFVRQVTRPANKSKVVRATLRTARKLEKSANIRRLASLSR
ncbi:MAG: phage tail tip lysozyme [Pseudomonadota bacterium]